MSQRIKKYLKEKEIINMRFFGTSERVTLELLTVMMIQVKDLQPACSAETLSRMRTMGKMGPGIDVLWLSGHGYYLVGNTCSENINLSISYW